MTVMGLCTNAAGVGLSDFGDLVGQGAALVRDDALGDRLDLVDPRVALVAGLVERRGVRGGGARAGGEIEAAGVRGVDQRAVVGLEQRAHVDGAEQRGVDRQPVGAGLALLARVQPVTLDHEVLDLDDHAGADRAVGDHERLRQGQRRRAQGNELDRHPGSLPRRSFRGGNWSPQPPNSAPKPAAGRALAEPNTRSVRSVVPWRRTRSCTATRTSPSWTVRATRRSWRRRRTGWVSPRSRSPTTTASTASSGSPSRPARSACRRSSAPSSPWAWPRPRWGRPTPTASTCSSWPKARAGTRRWRARSARRRCAARRLRPGTRSPT